MWREVLDAVAEDVAGRREVHRATSARRARGKVVAIVEGRRSSSIRATQGEEVDRRHRRDAVLRRVGRAGRRPRASSSGAARSRCASRSTDTQKPLAGRHRAPRQGARRAASPSATPCTSRSTTTRRTRDAPQPLGDAPPALGAAHGARRAGDAEGLARRARSPALRLRARQGRSTREEIARIEDLVNAKILDGRARAHRGASHRRGRASAARWPSSRRSTATSCACSR